MAAYIVAILPILQYNKDVDIAKRYLKYQYYINSISLN